MQQSGTVSYYDESLGEGGIASRSLGGTVRFQTASMVDVWRLDPGDIVQFELGHIDGVGQAVRVVLVAKGRPAASHKSQKRSRIQSARLSDKAECYSCHKLMIPRVVIVNERPVRSFCPFCGSVHKDFIPAKSSGVIKEVAGAALGSAVAGFLVSFISF